LSVGNVAGEFA